MKKVKYILILICICCLFTSCKKQNGPTIGENGNWHIGETDTGVKAEAISVVSILKEKTNGNVDTYRITYSNNTSTTFEVTNGLDGKSLNIISVDVKSQDKTKIIYEIKLSNNTTFEFEVLNGVDGKDGNNGINGNFNTIKSITLDTYQDLYRTYLVTLTDNSTFSFVVKDGSTPYIGDNGHWFIDDKDTGVIADYSKVDNRQMTEESDGLEYQVRTVNGQTGFIVTEWNKQVTKDKYHIVIPSYIGSVPVIGIDSSAFMNDSYITSISLSENLVYLDDSAFENSSLEAIDFNNCKLKSIPDSCFYGAELKEVVLSSEIESIENYAFYNCSTLENITFNSKCTSIGDYAFYSVTNLQKKLDFTQFDYIGEKAFYEYPFNAYIANKTTLGEYAFYNSYVFYEREDDESFPEFTSSSKEVIFNCQKNDQYIYTTENDTITLYEYIENSKEVFIPSQINQKDVTNIHYSFFDYKGKEQNKRYIDILYLSDTIEEINISTIINTSNIYIPKTIKKINYNTSITDLTPCKLLFEGSIFPTIIIDGKEYTTQEINELYADWNYNQNILKDNIYYDQDTRALYYDKDKSDDEISLLSMIVENTKTSKVLSTQSDKKVTRIEDKAIYLNNVQSLFIQGGITSICKYSILGDQLEEIFIPATVERIYSNGIYVYSSIYYLETQSIPYEWDNLWASKSISDLNICYGIAGDAYKDNGVFRYEITNNEVTLVKNISSYSTIYIPKEIDGYPVTRIATNFDNKASFKAFYIPNSIRIVDKGAFNVNNNNYYTYYPALLLEDASIPETWDANFAYVNGSSSYNPLNYVDLMYSVEMPTNFYYTDEYIYTIKDDYVVLLHYLGSSTKIYIPRTINNYPVKEINSYCFNIDSYDQSIYIYVPKTIENVKDYAAYIYSRYTCYVYFEASSTNFDSICFRYYYYYSVYSCSTRHNYKLDY